LHCYGSYVMQLSARTEICEINPSNQRQRNQRKNHVVADVLGEVRLRIAVDIKRISSREVQGCRKIGKITGPIHPSTNKSGKLAKSLLGLNVKFVFIWISRR